jgi:hypothetical protein
VQQKRQRKYDVDTKKTGCRGQSEQHEIENNQAVTTIVSCIAEMLRNADNQSESISWAFHGRDHKCKILSY